MRTTTENKPLVATRVVGSKMFENGNNMRENTEVWRLAGLFEAA